MSQKAGDLMKGICKFPNRVVAELSSECNLACAMCPRKYLAAKGGFMAETLWHKIIDEISDNEPDAIIIPFWRGESLLHRSFVRLMRYALNKKMRIHISTNGVVQDDTITELLLECEFVTFSIHNNIGFASAKRLLRLRKTGSPVIQVSFVRDEVESWERRRSLASSRDLEGFDAVRVYEEHTQEGVFGKTGIGVKDNCQRTFCSKLTDTIVIAYDGTVSRCNHIWTTEKSCNVKDMTIRQIWNSSYFNKVRGNYPDILCSRCDQWIGHTRGESYRMVNGKKEHQVFS